MAPTRTTRSASTKPASTTTAQTIQKPKSRARSHPIKRAASPDRAPSPPPKRSKLSESEKSENAAPTTRKPRSKAPASVKKQDTARSRAKKPLVNGLPTVTEEAPQQKPYFNPLPTPPPKTRPAPLLWAWGAGNFGQFGMGPDVLSELPKPKKNLWVEEKMQEGLFGGVGAGIESMAAGGLHSLFIDENGTVCLTLQIHSLTNVLQVWSCGVNDDAALGRITKDVPDPNNPGKFLDIDELTSVPHPLASLVDEKFRAVSVSTGDNICAAVSSEGDLRVWGSFRVCHLSIILIL
jgi:regulator of chromosome condensation